MSHNCVPLAPAREPDESDRMTDYFSYIPLMTEASGVEPPYRWATNETAPWTPMTKPLSQSKVAMLCTGGIRRKQDKPFLTTNDLTFRRIPAETDPRTLFVDHPTPIRAAVVQDVNCNLPLERLPELAGEGVIGSAASEHYSIVGAIYKRTALCQETAPKIAERLRAQGADALLLIPL